MKVFEKRRISAEGNLLSMREFLDFSGFENTEWIEKNAEEFIKNGEQFLETPYPMLEAHDYMRFIREGDRSVYDGSYYKRRSMLLAFLFAELSEKKGRFTDRISDGVWHILEETTWSVPAHLKKQALASEYAEKVDLIDLFSASTSACLAVVYRLGGGILDGVTPVIRKRTLYELYRRTVRPFCENDDLRWMGSDGRRELGNWTTWICENVLVTCMLCFEDMSLREKVAKRAMLFLDRFTDGYKPDGGCSEGPNYWGAAGAAYFSALELLYDASGGKIDVFDAPLVKNIGEYIEKVHISDNRYVMFADSHLLAAHDGRMIARFGRRVRSDKLESFGGYLADKKIIFGVGQTHVYRDIRNFSVRTPKTPPYRPAKRAYLKNLEVMCLREFEEDRKGLFLAVKGGHNDEHHNHNDVGNFVVYQNGEPLIIDAGVGTYTANTFGSTRYGIWTMQSAYHNLPTFNGIMQERGKEFCAKNTVFYESGAAFNLEGAYPAETGLVSYRRKTRLEDGRVIVCDEFALKENGEFFFSFMFADRPEINEGYAQMTGGMRLEFGGALAPVLDKIDISKDAGLCKRDWGRDFLWRLRLYGKGKTGRFEFIIRGETK